MGILTTIAILIPVWAVNKKAQNTDANGISSQNTKSEKQLSSELAKLTKVSLDTLRKLDKQTDRPTAFTYLNNGVFSTLVHIKTLDDKTTVSGCASICQESGCFAKEGLDKLPEKHISISLNGHAISVIDLAPFAALYKKASGNELKYVKLATERGINQDIGEYAGVYVIPIEKMDGEIKDGIPVLAVACTEKNKKVYTDENVVVDYPPAERNVKQKSLAGLARKYLGIHYNLGGRNSAEKTGLDEYGLILLALHDKFGTEWEKLSPFPSRLVLQLDKAGNRRTVLLPVDSLKDNVATEELQEGDLIFLLWSVGFHGDTSIAIDRNGQPLSVGHAGICSGKGNIIHASCFGADTPHEIYSVYEEPLISLMRREKFIGFIRVRVK
jgi:hypothetical protein